MLVSFKKGNNTSHTAPKMCAVYRQSAVLMVQFEAGLRSLSVKM